MLKDSQKSLVPSRGQKMTSGTKAKVPLTALSQKWKRDREQTLEAAYVPVVVDPRGQNPDTSIRASVSCEPGPWATSWRASPWKS
uniref:Predicted gene, 50461 n=1 Tax=Mus musculus TaxID=10090 RepID=A0A571BF43_MOUSE